MSWQPIETAPKDGTNIWCFATGKQGELGISWQGAIAWKTVLFMPGETPDWMYVPNGVSPTHWMPLPEPPEAQK